MVCNRCKMVVKSELDKLGLPPISVELGEIKFDKELTNDEKKKIAKVLINNGFEILDDKISQIIEKVKTIIINIVHHQNNELKTNLSTLIASKLNQDYNTISNLFSEVEGKTIESYFIAQKIERVKELLIYDELTLSQIAFQMNYSSVGYLSNQFKKVTGFTPTYFKQIKEKKRKQIDSL